MKEFIRFFVIVFLILLLSGLLLTGCTKNTPTSTIVEHHVQLVDETIDYAQNNMGDDADTKLLINSLKTCKTGLLDAEQAYKGEIATCESKTKYWRLSTFGLALLVLGIVLCKIKRFFL